MKTYYVTAEWAGYCRGVSVYEIDAENEEEAQEMYREGVRLEHRTVRDDTETQDIILIEEVGNV